MAKPASPIWTPGAIGTEGCLGYWLLHEGSGTTAADLSPADNDGTITDASLWGTDNGDALLTGFSDTKHVAIDPATPILDTSSYPFWCAVLFRYSSGDINDFLVCQASTASTTPLIGLRVSDSTGGIGYFARAGGSKVPNLDVAVGADDGEWHVAMGVSYSATDHRLYFDGSEVAADTANLGTPGSPFDVLTLGVLRRATTSSQNAFPGAISAAAAGNGAVPDPAALATDWLSGTFAAAVGASGAPRGAIHLLRSPFLGG